MSGKTFGEAADDLSLAVDDLLDALAEIVRPLVDLLTRRMRS